MNLQSRSTITVERSGEHNGSEMRLPGRWHLLARSTWAVLLVLTLVVLFVNLPAYFASLQTACAGIACGSFQLSPEQARVLAGIGLSTVDYAAYYVALTLATMAVCVVISAIIIWRRSGDRMAVLVALMLVTFVFNIFTLPSNAQGSTPFWQVLAECLSFLAIAFTYLVFLLFPSGQFVPRWTRWTFVVFLVGQALDTFSNAPFLQYIPLGFLTGLGEAAILVIVQIYRYRYVSSPRQRQQTKWVVYGLTVPGMVFVGYGLTLLVPTLADLNTRTGAIYQLASQAILVGLSLFIPLSFGFAILRSRLWDIDILINRTLVYGTLTGILALIYFGCVIGLQNLVRGLTGQAGQSPLIIVGSTLAIAALFQPLRRRIQRIIDRRFYRRKYDAARTIAAFSATLRSEVDLNELREHLVAVVQETMQPTHVSLWLRPPEQAAKRQPMNNNPQEK